MCNPIAIAGFTALQVASGQQQIKAMKAQARVQKQQLEREETLKNLQYLEAENNRSQMFQEMMAANQAKLAAMGITGEGGSYKALAKKNENIYKDDIQNIRFDQFNFQQDMNDRRRLIDQNLKANVRGIRLNQLATIVAGGYSYDKALAPGNKLSDAFNLGTPDLPTGSMGYERPGMLSFLNFRNPMYRQFSLFNTE